MDHYADDLAQLIEQLDLRDVSLIGFSTGGGEVARYVGRHGTGRIASHRPHLRRAAADAAHRSQSRRAADRGVRRVARGQPRRSLPSSIATSRAGRSSASTDPALRSSQGIIDSFWLQGMTAGHKNAYDCIAAFSATDFTDDLARFDKPTLDPPRRRRSDRADRRRRPGREAARAERARWSSTRARLTASPTLTRIALNADLLTFLRGVSAAAPDMARSAGPVEPRQR